ncbi:MAG: hypothetical protein ACK5Z5_06565 [Neisseriaceae bacterium]|jgi:hypothetical protein
MPNMIRKIHNILHGLDLSKRQLEKIADQIRLLSWAQGAIFTSAAGFDFKLNFITIAVIVILWIFLQIAASMVDQRSEKK